MVSSCARRSGACVSVVWAMGSAERCRGGVEGWEALSVGGGSVRRGEGRVRPGLRTLWVLRMLRAAAGAGGI
eukprot:5555565-Prymnesium_polylepis.2